MKLKKHVKAFSMVEIVIAVMVIGCAFVPIINLFQFGTSGTSNNINEIMAINYASDVVNCMRVIRFSDMAKVFKDKGNSDKLELNSYEELAELFKDVMSMPRQKEETEIDKLYPVKVNIEYHSGSDMSFFSGLAAWGSKVLLKREPDTVASYLIKVSVAYPKGDMRSSEKIAASFDSNKKGKGLNHVVLYSMLVEQ